MVLAPSLFALSLAFSLATTPALPAPEPRWRGFRAPLLRRDTSPPGAPIAEIRLRPLLDRNRSLVSLRLGETCGPWHAGLGYDAAFRERFLLLSCGNRLVARRFAPGDGLLRGILVEPERGVRYRLRFHLRVPDIIGASFLSLEPLSDSPEGSVRLHLLDLIRRAVEAGVAVDVEGRELLLFYMTDIEIQTLRPAASRTLLIVERRGLRTAAWPIPESSLPAGIPVQARLGSRTLTLVRTLDGTLFVYPSGGRLSD